MTRVRGQDAQLDPRIGDRDRGRQRLRQHVGDAFEQTDAHHPGDLAPGRADLQPRPLQLGQCPPGMRDEQLAVSGEHHPLSRPLEQRHADLFLQRADLPGDGGLDHPQQPRGRGHAAHVGHGHQRRQLPDFHQAHPSFHA
jgi:hypothetical protein